jgi:hypothetical protein
MRPAQRSARAFVYAVGLPLEFQPILMPTPPSDRLRWIVPGLGCLAFVFASIWILLHPELGGRVAAISGLLFFGPAGAAMLWSAMRRKSFPQRARTRSRIQSLIVPAVLLVTLAGALKFLFALPLLLAWLLLFPRYESRRITVLAASAAAAIAVAQAVMFGISMTNVMAEAGSSRDAVLQAVFAVLVVGLDVQVLSAVRTRLRGAAAANPS